MYEQRQQRLGWLIGGGIGPLLVIIGVVCFFFFKPNPVQVQELPFADALLTYDKEAQQLVVTTADREATRLGEWKLAVDWMQADRYGNGVYVLEKTSANQATVYDLTLSENLVDLSEKYRFEYAFTDETVISLDEDALVLYEPSTQTFTSVNTEFFTTKTYQVSKKQTVSNWYSTDDTLYYSVGSQLRMYSWQDEKALQSVGFEDPIVALFVKENSIYVLNEFGTSSNYTTVFELDPKTLGITNLGKLDALDLELYPVSHVSNSVFLKGMEARSKKSNVLWWNPVEDLKVSEWLDETILEQAFVFTAHDYLYTLSESGDVSVFSKHSNRPVYTLEGNFTEVYPLWITTHLETPEQEELLPWEVPAEDLNDE